MMVSRTILPQMVDAKNGLVINVSSGSSMASSCPLLSVYAASKAFLNHWTPSMNAEYNRSGIFFETLTPFYVTSKLSKFRKPTLSIPTPQTYAKSVFAQVGNKELHSGYWVHNVMVTALNLLPTSIVASYMYNMHYKIRQLALKKAQQAK